MEHKYFVSFANPHGYGNLEVTRDTPISSLRDVQEIARLIEADRHMVAGSVCVLLIYRLEDRPETL